MHNKFEISTLYLHQIKCVKLRPNRMCARLELNWYISLLGFRLSPNVLLLYCYYFFIANQMSELVTARRVSHNKNKNICILRYCGLMSMVSTRYIRIYIAIATIKSTNQCICARLRCVICTECVSECAPSYTVYNHTCAHIRMSASNCRTFLHRSSIHCVCTLHSLQTSFTY